MTKSISTLIIAALAAITLSSCSRADMRTTSLKKEGLTVQNEKRGRELLQKAWNAHGFDRLSAHKTYEITGRDHWRGMMGAMGNPWPGNDELLNIKFAAGTFDSRFEKLKGKKKGKISGMQSWNYYRVDENGSVEFTKPEKPIRFVLAAYQYFFELADRLQKAPIVVFAGEKSWNNKEYNLVLATWWKVEPHKEHDQYLLYINQETNLIDGVEYSLRENYLPAPPNMYGSIRFEDVREIDGFKVPFEQYIFIGELQEDKEKYVHRLRLDSFEFDSFPLNDLYPNKALDKVGDSKEIAAN